MQRISILGDSVSTFYDLSPKDGVFYDHATAAEAELTGAEDTWWMQVIRGLGGLLHHNSSYAGTGVTTGGEDCGRSEHRLRDLAGSDVVLVFLGLNDAAGGLLPTVLEAEYRALVRDIQKFAPGARVFCLTLPKARAGRGVMFRNVEWAAPLNSYSEAIRRAVKAENAELLDVAARLPFYTAMDGVHPDKNGMAALAKACLEEMNGWKTTRSNANF